ncbi:hypothetical protein NMY22_g5579 [Coprinellus aureogranulatus]|nr:hypothetical protein NMY22_g5579 [Coprinellus aureogranulatus]
MRSIGWEENSIYLQDRKPGLRNRVASNASIASTYTNHGYTSSSGVTSLHKRVLKKKTAEDLEVESASMGRRWIRWMHKRNMREWVVPSAVAFAVLLKVCIGVGSYSGEGTPPMYGDYEAQRHWMELTQHLPFREWYTYDLQYWGLDYPPLTAYHSWLCGFIGSLIDPSALLTLLLQPALLLIDNGHFQFNSVMLGLTVLSLCAFARGKDELGAVAFVGALGFKQMSLYYAPAIGSYLLAKCVWRSDVRLFTRLAIVTVASFALLFLPFYLPPLASSPKDVLNPISRIFPFSRGLFEDKVANWWCASNVVIKWKRIAGDAKLVRASAGLTAIGK